MIIGFDLETTGLDKKQNKIIEIALVKFDEKTFTIVDTYSTFINPETKIPDLISNLTSIYDSDVENAPKIGEVKQEVLDFIGNAPLLGHNVFFDRDFFIQNGIDISKNILLDTFFLANFLRRYEKSLNLEMLCKSYGIGFSGAHRALNDVHATISLFEKLMKTFHELESIQKEKIHYIFTLSEDVNINYMEFLLFGENEPECNFEKFETTVLANIKNKLQIDENINDRKVKRKSIKKLFSSLGSVEERENQLKMSEMVEESLGKRKKTVIEAPTGLGKSFAYLIPSIQHAVLKNEKVFISTKTKNLQDQLYTKDLGFLKKSLDIDFTFAKLKGKSNYLSTKSFFDEILLEGFSYTKVNLFLKLTLWIEDTVFGELDELNYFGPEFGYLRFLNSEGLGVLGEKNPYKNHEFLVYARYQVEISDIIIVNHSLLFSDIHSDNGVLGNIKNLIIDEAHNVEDSVTESVKQRINEKNTSELFDIIETILNKKHIDKFDFLKQKEIFLSHMDLLVDYSASYVQGKVNNGHAYQVALVQEDYFSDMDISQLLKKIELHLLDIVDILAVIEDYDFSKEVSLLNTLSENIKLFLKHTENNPYIKTISVHERQGVSLEFTLLNPGNYLYEKLWSKLQSVVLTSATLQISGSFQYIEKLLSLKDFDFHLFKSDFDYQKQATLFVPSDLGNIKNNNDQVVHFLDKLYSVVRGKTLTLLTSFSIIKKIYTSLNTKLLDEGIHLYPQGVGGSKSKLLSFYLENPEESILLGTDSFWEGVDIPGEKLKYLVIHKFPFSVPTDPVFQARSIFFKDPFLEYSVPKAIIKLKQGFGRLIRTKNDTGIVILLDDRIYSTQWGNNFFDAFPGDINKKYVSSEQFLHILEKSLQK
ncbi:MAG: DEAD/DEAH box helicase [Candidatus Gracilibacteria bacterium]|nr:DEAD/DEAH box helicase [Candidatus Gracilibacteria bacterium]